MALFESSAYSSLQVMVYTDAMGIGGAELSLGHLIANVSSDIAVTVVGVSPQVVDAIAAQRPCTERIVLPETGFQSLVAHIATFHRLKPEIVHFNLCTPWACAIGLVAALSLPNSRVVRVDQLPLRTTDAIELWRTRALSLRVDAHVAVGDASARRMEDFYALGRHTVLSVPNGVPEPSMHEIATTRQPDGTLLVGSVGRLDAMKAHDVLLRAIAQVEDVWVEILGEGEQRAALETLAVELGIGDRVSLPGWIEQPRDRLPNYDLFVLPSRSEGFPLAIVEAMLAARPVIATRVGSIAEAVIHGETGLLIEKSDVDGLAAALRSLKDDPALRDRLGQRGRDVAMAEFTASQMAKRYEEIWQKVLSIPRSPRLSIPRPRD
ncbi:MAG: glycosyltransferase family 4 protein [Stenomitos rutilans HA7619-LM2]|jgi:glycosyltransferase involved in cell wall biosynthesis|nr:glycosyltransferase family 4 protein [Stenomitos rutilans HA7619-LM2]